MTKRNKIVVTLEEDRSGLYRVTAIDGQSDIQPLYLLMRAINFTVEVEQSIQALRTIASDLARQANAANDILTVLTAPGGDDAPKNDQ